MSRKAYADTNISLESIDPILKDFLDAQKPKTKRTYGCLVRKLLQYTNHQTGKQMLRERAAWSQKIMVFLQWLKTQGYSDSYATTACGMVRSFFDFYHKPLSLSRQERTRLKERNRSSEDYLFSKEDISKMATVGSLKEKYVVLIGASFGLRNENFALITYGKFRVALDRARKEEIEAPIPLDPICTQKERGVKAFPFINSDALPIIQQFLMNGKDRPDSERVWNERPSQLTVVLQNLAKKSGIDAHGMRIRFHSLRKYLIDRLSASMSESKWKQVVGKKVSESAYVSSSELREGYLRAVPLICINGNGSSTRKELEELAQKNAHSDAKIAALEAETAELRPTNRKYGELREENMILEQRLAKLERLLEGNYIGPIMDEWLERRKEKAEDKKQKSEAKAPAEVKPKK